MRVHPEADHGFKRLVNGRAVQLDGLRAVAMMAICWDHWCPASWPRVFPFEVFLFFFLVLTGYLITGSLLRERDRSEARGGAWKAAGTEDLSDPARPADSRALLCGAGAGVARPRAGCDRLRRCRGMCFTCRISTWRCSATGRLGRTISGRWRSSSSSI